MMKHWASLMRTLPASPSLGLCLFIHSVHTRISSLKWSAPPQLYSKTPHFSKPGNLLLREKLSVRATYLSPQLFRLWTNIIHLKFGLSFHDIRSEASCPHGGPDDKWINASLSQAEVGGHASFPLSSPSPVARERGEAWGVRKNGERRGCHGNRHGEPCVSEEAWDKMTK